MVWEHPTAIVLLFVAGYVILFLVGASIVTVKIDSLQLHRLKNFGSGGATSFGWFQWILSSNELKRIWRLIKMLIQIFGSQEMTIRNTSNRLLAIWWQSDEKIRKKTYRSYPEESYHRTHRVRVVVGNLTSEVATWNGCYHSTELGCYNQLPTNTS